VVIDIINILCIAIEAKDHSSVCPNCHRPKTFHLAFQRMQPESRQVHVSNRRGSMKRCQNIPQLFGVFRVYAAWVALFKKPFQSLVADCLYQPEP
jgi:hypothetical protein